MAEWLIAFALRQRVLVVVVALMIGGFGVYALDNLSIDAFPDVTNIQVQVITEAPGRSPLEVERFITIPLEIQMTGLPGLTELRSLSKFGLSLVTVVFRDDVDVYFARQIALERLIAARSALPSDVDPVLGPVSTGLGEVFRYTVEKAASKVAGEAAPAAPWSTALADLREMRTVQDWVIRPYLKGTPGVADVNSHGGYVKQYQVLVDPDKLKTFGLSLGEVFESIGRNNANAGGNILERHAEQYLVRGVGLIHDQQDIRDIVVKEHQGVPIYVRDVAEVGIGHEVRHGAAVKDGYRNNLLPPDVRIVPFYDRTELVTAALWTVQKALAEGIVLVVIVLFVFLGNIRSALIVTATLVLAPLMTFIGMWEVDLSANLMSLGGLAVAIGMIADGSVVVVENIYRHLSERKGSAVGRLHVTLEAAREVARPVVYCGCHR